MKPIKIDKPRAVMKHVDCRSCGIKRQLDDFRFFRSSPTDRLYMDFCVECEQRSGTLSLYRRYGAYSTEEIAHAVFAASRTPPGRRSADQARLLVEPKTKTVPRNNEELVHQEMARREMARRRLIFFTTAMMPSYKACWVHQDICRRLERFVKQVELGLSPRLMLFVPPRHGKLCADSTPVLTTCGWKTHGELQAGDFVFGIDGKPIEVLGVSPPDMASLEVELSNGEKIKVHPNHEWTVYDRSYRKFKTYETNHFVKTTKFGKHKQVLSGGRSIYQLPPRRPVELPAASLPLDPYMLGVWLGDGKSKDGSFCYAEADRVVYDAAVNAGFVQTWHAVHRDTGVNYAGSKFLTVTLREMGLCGNKQIPEQYQLSSIDQRLELLAGLIDTDGHVERKTGRARIATCSDKLRDDIVQLANSLGFEPYVYTQPPALSSSGIQGNQPVHYVGFQPTIRIPTRVPRKRIDRLAPQRAIGIVSVAPCAPEKGRCIQVAAEDGLYLVGRQLVPTHNSQLSSGMFPDWVLGHHPEWKIISASYGMDLATDFSREVRDRIKEPDYSAIFPNTKLHPEKRGVESWATTKGGGYIPAGVGTGITGKGMHIGIADDIIKDYSDAMSEQVRNNTFNWYNAVFRNRLAPGGGILLIGTRWHYDDPSGRLLNADHDLEKAGVPVEEREGWEVISYPAIAEQDEYLMRDGTILAGEPEDESQVLRRLRRRGEALTPERYPLNELLKLKNAYTTSQWSSLYQQSPSPEDGDFFIKDDFVYRWLDPAYRKLCRTFLCVDYAISKKQRRDYTVAAVFALDSNDDLYVLEIRRGRWKTREIASNIVALVDRHKPEVYAGEQGQIHSAVWPIVKEELDKLRLYISIDESLVPIQDKEVRARPMQGRMQRRKLIFSFDEATKPDIYDLTERELLQFPNGVNDDIVDCLSWGARLALNTALPNSQAPPPKRVRWEDKLKIVGATNTSYMAG